ncbi:hypothetical protein C8R43DRAFT_613951 [Mycena crocata]|nr:hypothetical protein C8R43DRAFT_613951 [Mycena crocata]
MEPAPPSSAPVFPEDLEREIFELSARSRPSAIPKLMLVAWRVKTWVEPLLYRTITVPMDSSNSAVKVGGIPIHRRKTLVDIIRTKPPELFSRNVRNLLIGFSGTVDNEPIISACCNVENLWIASDDLHALLPLLARMPLKHLYCPVERLFGSQRDIQFTHPIFARITHLELFDTFEGNFLPEFWSDIGVIPNLTHLAVSKTSFLPLCLNLLRSHDSLRIVVALRLDDGDTANLAEDHELFGDLVQDLRFVTMSCFFDLKDWQMGCHVGVDYWSRAEDFVGKRKSGEIHPSASFSRLQIYSNK